MKNLIDRFHEEWKDMAVKISHSVPEGDLREKLHDQLSWLKKQIDYYEENPDLTQLRVYFNEVVDSLNSELMLGDGEEFKRV